MNSPFLEKFGIEKKLLYILLTVALLVLVFIFYLLFSQGGKSIKIQTPNGGEEWEIGESYQISWKAKGIDKVGIVLFKGKEAKWIAKNIPASQKKYQWQIYPGQAYGGDYWIAVFEYPWQGGNLVDYSDGPFAITFAEFVSCDDLSVQKEWPYLPSDLPNIRKAFLTSESYSGNLDGLEGAGKICQEAAQAQGLDGDWMAFLGGDSDQETAFERLKASPRGLNGIFVEANPTAELTRGATCHRLLGKNFNGFLEKFSNLAIINEEKLEEDFFQDLANVWLGRIDKGSKKNCEGVEALLSHPYKPLAEKYSFTLTCQNWTAEKENVEGYPAEAGEFPTCYTPQGKITDAVALGGLASGLSGNGMTETFTDFQVKSCDTNQKLLCIEN